MQAIELSQQDFPTTQLDPVSDRMVGYFRSGSAIRKMFEEGLRLKAEHGEDQVADLSIGNPNFLPPEAFDAAMREVAHERGSHSYMPNAGYEWVRSRVAAYLNQHGLFERSKSRHIIMTTGAAGALNVVLAAILRPGDEVIVSRPYFVEYRFYVELHDGKFVPVAPGPDFEIDPEAVERALTGQTRAIIVNSPNNPSGRVYRRDTLMRLADVLDRHERATGNRVYLISDEPYRDLVYDDVKYTSPATVYPDSFICYSWSKSFSIPGERIGYLAVNPAMRVNDWQTVMGTLAMCNRILGFINAPAFMQRVLGVSLGERTDLGHYRAKRDRICSTLRAAGYDFPEPEGAFYVFVRTPLDEDEFIAFAKSKLLLVVPGSGFGMPGYFRLCYAAPDATVALACEKLLEIKREIDAA